MARSRKAAPSLSSVDDFGAAVVRVVRTIPKGRVLAYGEVALLAGRPGAARAVVRILHANPGLPWWRVVRANRTLAPEVAAEQTQALAKEGVRVANGRVQTKLRVSDAGVRESRSARSRSS